MAKRKKMVRKVKARAIKSSSKKSRSASHFPKIANILVQISLFFLGINAVLLIFLRDKVLESLKLSGVEASASSLALMGLLWLMLAFFAWSINKSIKEKMNRVSIWELLILSIVTLFSGRFEAGTLILIASIIYLVKSKKKK